MKPIQSDIERAAGFIINETGIDALTVEALSRQMEISKNELLIHFKSDEDILKFMVQRFENEIQTLVTDISAMHHEPEKEVADLFKSLYDFFNRKPYYLDLMIADLFHLSDTSIKSTLLKIREDIRSYLIQIIKKGKLSGAFNPNMNASHAADSIIDNFRFFMSDIPYTHKMMQDLKRFRERRE